jgi:MFS family permease
VAAAAGRPGVLQGAHDGVSPCAHPAVTHGPWRAVWVLGVTQILAWGAIFYTPVLMVPLIAAERGWSPALAMGGFSLGLLSGGVVAPMIGRSIDRYGGHVVMSVGSLLGAAGLAGLALATHPLAYAAVWMVLGVAMASSLYDPAFATLGRIFGPTARRPITMLTLAGGFASTVSWPATHLLLGVVGWRGTYLIYAALLALVAAPLHAFALPRERADPHPPVGRVTPPAAVLPASGWVFVLVTAAFSAYAFIPSALSAHLLAVLGRAGLDAGTAVFVGALFGPSQVAARLGEFALGGRAHPLWIARFALGLIVAAFVLLAASGLSVAAAAVFAVMFGMANGLMTIARGTLPLALFGSACYGALMGRIAGPFLVMQATAPFVFATIAERASDAAALACAAALALVSLACFAAVRRADAGLS